MMLQSVLYYLSTQKPQIVERKAKSPFDLMDGKRTRMN